MLLLCTSVRIGSAWSFLFSFFYLLNLLGEVLARPKIDEINLISFGSNNNLSKEVEGIKEGGKEGPCTSYSHRGAEQKHGEHLEFKF